jgi:hypothetical protein
MSNIAVPCPRCGHGLAEDWAKSTVHCGCGYGFHWISPPESEIPKSRNFGIGWFWFAFLTFFLLAKLWPIAPGWSAILLFVIIFAGRFLVRRVVIATAHAISRRRYSAWLSSEDAKRYHDYQRKRDVADEARRRAEENARKAEEERIRRVLAEEARRREYLLGLSPQAFEENVAKLFSALGYNSV